MSYKLKNLEQWKSKISTESVQNDNATFGGDFLSSETLVLFSGPASLGPATTFLNMVPIGLVQNVQVSQQKQIQQLFEIGSKKPYFIPGRNIIGGGIGRVLFDGPSLMYAMYLREANNASPTNKGLINPKSPIWKPTGTDQTDHPTWLNNADSLGEEDVEFKGGSSNIQNPTPGYFFMNLGSSFFHRPTGLGFVLFDGENEPYGGFYLENCYIQSHAFSVSSQQTILMEQVSFRASSLKPFNPSQVG